MNQVKPTVIGYIQLDVWTTDCPYICYGLMSKEYMNFVVDHNHKQGYITKLKPVYKRESVCKRIAQIIEEF